MFLLKVSSYLILFTNFCGSIFCLDSDILVTLPNGQIRGHELKTPGGSTFYGFQGIPYATPPIGSLRFQAPQSINNWEGILDASVDAKDCISINSVSTIPSTESEDCLYVNVYTPNFTNNDSSLLPVMVYIFGGGFNYGTSSYSMYGPDYLIEEGVVFVSFNYRVAALGFLSTGDDVIPGNAGLKDQNLALKWIKQNVRLFGGDPDKITIFGESAGAASVAYHIASEMSAGLFRAGILESGTSLGWWALNTNPKQFALDMIPLIGGSVDVNNVSSSEILEFFKDQPAEKLNQALMTMYTTQNKRMVLPVLEQSDNADAFITKSTYQSLQNGEFNKVPILIGIQSEEYLVLMGSLDNMVTAAASYDENLENLIPIDLPLAPGANKELLSEQIKEIYLDSSSRFSDNLGATIRYNTDNEQSKSVIKHAVLQSQFTDVFFYKFSYHGVLGMLQNYSIPGTLGNAGHQEELPYLFKMKWSQYNIDTTNLTKFSKEDNLTHQRLIKIWSNFAKNMDPTPAPDDILQNITWPTVTSEYFSYVDIDENLTVVQGTPRGGAYEKWSQIYDSWSSEPLLTF